MPFFEISLTPPEPREAVKSVRDFTRYGIANNGGVIWPVLFWPSFLSSFYWVFIGSLETFRTPIGFVWFCVYALIAIWLTFVSFAFSGSLEVAWGEWKKEREDHKLEVMAIRANHRQELLEMLLGFRKILKDEILENKLNSPRVAAVFTSVCERLERIHAKPEEGS